MIPRIIIKYNRFLDPIFADWVKNQPKFKGVNIPTHGQVLKRVKKYNKLWSKNGDMILKALTKSTGLSFKRNQIEVHVVSVNSRSFSSPIVLKSGCSSIDFINILTHELIHCLFVDNCDRVNRHIPWNQKVEGYNVGNDHIFLHAFLKYIYLDVLKSPRHLKQNLIVSRKSGNEEYSRAWDVVEEFSYKELIREFGSRVKGSKEQHKINNNK